MTSRPNPSRDQEIADHAAAIDRRLACWAASGRECSWFPADTDRAAFIERNWRALERSRADLASRLPVGLSDEERRKAVAERINWELFGTDFGTSEPQLQPSVKYIKPWLHSLWNRIKRFLGHAG